LLAHASLALGESLDVRQTLNALAQQVVPDLADWCSIHIYSEETGLERIVVAHADPKRLQFAEEYNRRYPIDMRGTSGVAGVIRTGRPSLMPVITDEIMSAAIQDPEQLALVRQAGIGSVVIVPLRARGGTLGTLTLVHGTRGRYGEADVAWAEDLGRLAGLALDNARLFSKLQLEVEARRRTEQDRAVLAAGARCLIWRAEVSEGDGPHLDWKVTFPDEESARKFLPIAQPPGIPFKDAYYRARLHEDRYRCDWLGTEAIRAGRSYEQDFRMRMADGSVRWLHEDLRVEALEVGRRWSVVAVCTDITERKLAEDALVQSEDRFRQLADSMPQIAWVQDPDGKNVYLNRRYFEYTGLVRDVGPDATWASVIHPDDAEAARDVYREQFSRGEFWEQELRLRRADGLYRWHLARLLPARDADDQITQWFGTSTDIHEHKTKEATLRFLVDLDATVRDVSDEDEIIGAVTRRLGEFLHLDRCAYAEMEEAGEFSVRRDFTRGVPSMAGRHRLPSFGPDATVRLGQAGTYVVGDSAEEAGEQDGEGFARTQIAAMVWVPLLRRGRVVASLSAQQALPRRWSPEEVRLVEMVAERCWSGVQRVIAERELREANSALEARVAERTQELTQAIGELEGFTYAVSHDLRAPLRAIVATSRILEEDFGGELSAPALHQLSRQATNARKLAVLIDDLLRLSRLGREEIRREPIDFTGLACEITQELGIDAVERVEVQEGLVAVADARLLRLVLLNLIDNALKFSPRGGKVMVGGNGDEFFVRDEGIGFDMEFADKLFRPFERLVTENEFPGTGIGLANVRRIVERHGGRVWAASAPGMGATFSFTLPRPSAA